MRLSGGLRPVLLAELAVVAGARSTVVMADGARIGTVEHLFAALGGAGIHEGLSITIEGDELPILDGGAVAWSDALADVPGRPPRLRIERTATLEVGASRYDFTVADALEVAVTVDFDDARLAARASWSGDRADFVARIAPARTFGFAHEVEALLARGLAQHVAPESVVVIAPDVIHHAGRPFAADEPARHKLLDLIGDLYLHGGPFRGRVHAHRPGHAATHAAMAQALRHGIVVAV